jgi:hypothetical protein
VTSPRHGTATATDRAGRQLARVCQAFGCRTRARDSVQIDNSPRGWGPCRDGNWWVPETGTGDTSGVGNRTTRVIGTGLALRNREETTQTIQTIQRQVQEWQDMPRTQTDRLHSPAQTQPRRDNTYVVELAMVLVCISWFPRGQNQTLHCQSTPSLVPFCYYIACPSFPYLIQGHQFPMGGFGEIHSAVCLCKLWNKCVLKEQCSETAVYENKWNSVTAGHSAMKAVSKMLKIAGCMCVNRA